MWQDRWRPCAVFPETSEGFAPYYLAGIRHDMRQTTFPATYSECGRVIEEVVARNQWEEVGVLAQTQPTRHRPGTVYKGAEGSITLYGKP